MAKKLQTKPNAFDATLWLDKSVDIDSYKIPPLDETDPEPYKEFSRFPELQTRAWVSYLRTCAWTQLGGTGHHSDITDQYLLAWVNALLSEKYDGEPLSPDEPDDPPQLRRLNSTSFIPMKILNLVESIIPGSARIYFWGPDMSCLWSTLAGTDDGAAMSRLTDLTGLSLAQISECDERLFDELLNIYEPIALHALSATLSMFHQNSAFIRGNLTEALFLFHPDIQAYLPCAESSPDFFREIEPDGAIVLDALLDDPNFIVLRNDPWYKRVCRCLEHDATIARLDYYGLSRADILSVTGTPSEPSPKKGQIKYGFDSTILSTWHLDLDSSPSASAAFTATEKEASLGDAALYWYSTR